MNLDQLTAFDPSGFTAAVRALEDASQATNSSQDQLSSAAAVMGSWGGQAADAYNTRLCSWLDALIPTPPLLSGTSEALDSFVTAVTIQQDIAKTAKQQAESLPWPSGRATVGPDGTVTSPPRPLPDPGPPSYATPTPQGQATQQRAAQAMQQWDDSNAEAQQLQTTLQEALKAATAADTRASGDMSQAAGGAKAFPQVVAGNTNGALSALTSDQLGVQGDGSLWSKQFADQASELAKRAATDPKAAAQLQHDYGNLARYDPAFATALLNQLGPKGMEQLVTREGYYEIRHNAGSGPAIPATADPLLMFLSNSLATGTARIDDPLASIYGDSVDPGYLSQLVAASNSNEAPGGRSSVPGWWALGQIMSAAPQGGPLGQTPYGAMFLTTVGPAMVQWDQAHNAEGKQPDVGPSTNADNTTFYTDPLVGLMNAATTNPTGAQQLFQTPVGGVDPPSNGTAPHDVLTYLISDHHWSLDTFNSSQIPGDNIVYSDSGGGSDQGTALGQAIQAATGVGVPGGTHLATEAFGTYGQTVKADSGRAGDLSGMRDPMAHVLVQNYGAVQNTVLYGVAPSDHGGESSTLPQSGLPGGVDPGTVGDPRALAYTIAEISHDPHAYEGLQTAALVSSGGQMHTAGADPSLRALGFVVESHDHALVSQGATEDADALKRATELKLTISSGIDAVPLPENVGPAGDLSKALVDHIWKQVAPMPPANAHGAPARDLASHDASELNRYINSTYPVGPLQSPQEAANVEATTAITKGSQLASGYLNDQYVAVLPPN